MNFRGFFIIYNRNIYILVDQIYKVDNTKSVGGNKNGMV